MENQLTIGIYFGYAPGTKLHGEGLSRHAQQLTKALVRRDDIRVVVACPTWLEADLRDIIFGQEVADRIEFLTVGRPMLAFLVAARMQALANWRTAIRRPRGQRGLPFRRALKRALIGAGAATNPIAQGALIVLGAVLVPVIAVVTTVASVALGLTTRLAKWMSASKIWARAQILRSLAGRPTRPAAGVLRSLLSGTLDHLGINIAELRKSIVDIERARLVDVINRRKDIVGWLIPTAFWPEIQGLAAPYLLCVPDMVLREIPVKFAEVDPMHSTIAADVDKVVAKATNFITFSRVVARSFLVERHAKHPAHINVIPHGINRLDHHIRIMGGLLTDPSIERFASHLIMGHRNTRLQHSEYLRSFDFSSAKYIFYAAQPRPNKNFMVLLRAYEKALREKYIYQKLIVTADLSVLPDIWRYLNERRLQYDVVMMPGVTEPVLAALYHKATVAVCPSLFEGGYPFTFGEAMSVGTPTLLARSAVVKETLEEEPELMKSMTFDPFDVDQLAGKIAWAVAHRTELLALQQPLYDRLAKRTWDVAADDLVNAFRNTAESRRSANTTPGSRDDHESASK